MTYASAFVAEMDCRKRQQFQRFHCDVGADKALRYIKHPDPKRPSWVYHASVLENYATVIAAVLDEQGRSRILGARNGGGFVLEHQDCRRWMTIRTEVLGVFFGAIPERFFDYVNTNGPSVETRQERRESSPGDKRVGFGSRAVLPILEVTASCDSWRAGK